MTVSRGAVQVCHRGLERDRFGGRVFHQGIAQFRPLVGAELGQRHLTRAAGEQREPTWCSSCLIAVDNAGWVMNNFSAARR